MSATNGSQFFFWFSEASVEMTPKLISLGVSARTATELPISTRAANALFPSSDDIDGLPIALEPVKQTAQPGRELGHDPDRSKRFMVLSLVEHDLFRRPAPTFRDHALRAYVQLFCAAGPPRSIKRNGRAAASRLL